MPNQDSLSVYPQRSARRESQTSCVKNECFTKSITVLLKPDRSWRWLGARPHVPCTCNQSHLNIVLGLYVVTYWSTKDASVVRLYQKMKNLSLICILHLSLSPPVRLRTVLCGSKGFLFFAWLDPYLACWLVILLSMFLLCFELKPKKTSFFLVLPLFIKC